MFRRQSLEIFCWIVVGITLSGLIILLDSSAPEWVMAVLGGSCFLSALPIFFWDFQDRWQELKGQKATLGPVKFWVIVGATVTFILAYTGANMWLSDQIGWPEAYGFQCGGRGCFLEDLIHSPKLLDGGTAYELGLFAVIWLLPTFLVGCLLYAIYAGLKRRSSNSIQPLD